MRTCAPPITTWIAIQHGRPRSPGGRGSGASRCVRHATIAAIATTMSPTKAATHRWRTCAEVSSVRGGTRRPAHERPVREDQRRVDAARGHVRSEQQQGERGQRAERREQGEPLARPAAADPGRVAGTDRDVHQQPDQEHRRGKVGGDRLAAIAEPDGLAPEPRLEPDQRDGARATARGSIAGRDGRGGRGWRARGSRSRR